MIDRVDKEIRIFEIAKKPQIHQNVQSEEKLSPFPAPVNQKSENPVQKDRNKEQNNIAGLAPGIEQKTGSKQQNILIFRIRKLSTNTTGRKIQRKTIELKTMNTSSKIIRIQQIQNG